MSLSPHQITTIFRGAAKGSNRIDSVSDSQTNNRGHVIFDVQDKDGGILQVTVVQYKEPIR